MKRRKNHVLILMIFVLITFLLPLNAMAANSKVIPNDKTGIPDKVLYRVILKELGKGRGKTFTEKEAEGITYLSANTYGDTKCIRTLKGIGKLKNLTYLNVSFNRLKTIKYVKDLKKLKELDASINNLTSLSGIETLYGLESLGVSNNKLTSLSGVENLINLKSIDAHINRLKNINAVKNLVNLKDLEVDGNRLTSLKVLEQLPDLESVTALGNRLRHLPDLRNHTKMNEADFKYNRISKKEFKTKLPPLFVRLDSWYKNQIMFQNLVKKITPLRPKSLKDIHQDTKTITGRTNKKATVVLRDPQGKRIQTVMSDKTGKFIFRELNLAPWAGQRLSIESYLIDQLYGERVPLKTVKFIVRS